MADPHDTTKVEEMDDESGENEAEGSLSLESLDAAIAEEDPDFAKNLEAIIIHEAIHVVEDDGVSLRFTLADEIRLWQAAPGFKSKLAKKLPFIPKISFKLKIKRTAMQLSWLKFKEQAVYRLKHAVPLTLKWLKGSLGSFKEKIVDSLQAFKKFSLVKKLSFVGLVLVTAASAWILFRMGTKGLLPPEEEMFISSMSDWAGEKSFYDPLTEVESFYESTRTSQNILLMKRLLTNLRRSSESGENPMGAFEFYVEGTVSEVVVEIKDRESEVRDLFRRTIEEMTFDQVSSGEGKRLLCDRLRKEVNKILTTGYVRRIFIKNAIIKP